MTRQRLKYSFPKQGGYVVLEEAPTPGLEPFVGWKFLVTRDNSYWIRLRADYGHFLGGYLEISLDKLGYWRHKVEDRPLASYFSEVP